MMSEIFAQATDTVRIDWRLAARLQNMDGSPSPGFGGALFGIQQDLLVLAGGANFPDLKPWEGGYKYYSQEIRVGYMRGDTCIWPPPGPDTLPEPIAYCGSVSTPSGIVYAGGENEAGPSHKAWLLQWAPERQRMNIRPLPDLREAITNTVLTAIGSTIYLLGGDGTTRSSSNCYQLDIGTPDAQWQPLPPLPCALANATAIAQKDASGTVCIYVIGGRTRTDSGIHDLHSSVFIYDPIAKRWRTGSPVMDGHTILHYSAGAGIAIGEHGILLLGGDDGRIFHQIESYLYDIARSISPEEKSRLTIAKNRLIIDHAGFYTGILHYDTVKDRWTRTGTLPFAARVTTAVIRRNQDIILSTGEIRPGIRTPDIMIGKLK